MQINLNRQTEEIPTEGIKNFGELMTTLARRAERQGARVLQVKLNGEDVTGRDRSNLDEMPLEEVHDLDIETGDPKLLARSTLYSVADFLELLLKEMHGAAERFRLGHDEKSSSSFLRCLDGLQVFMHSLEKCRRLLGLSFELLYVPTQNSSGDITVAQNRRRLFEVLDAMIEAQMNQDWVLLADLLQYELIPVLEDWRLILPVVLEKAEGADAEPIMKRTNPVGADELQAEFV
jgi:hypothetical protein